MSGMYRRRRLGVGATLVVCLALLLAAAPATAQAAGEYDVQVCTPNGNARGHGLQMSESASNGPALNFSMVECGPVNAEPTISITAGSGLVVGVAEWTVTAPPGALIQSVTGDRAVRLSGSHLNGAIKWLAFPADPLAPDLEQFLLRTPASNGEFRWTPLAPTPVVHGRVTCQLVTGCSNLEHEEEQEEEISFTKVVAHLVDQSPPTLTTTGPLLVGGPVSGSRELSFKASDAGGGIARVSLLVDGVTKESKTDPNQGLCVKPYRATEPCALELDSSFSLDTRALPDGTHKVEVLVEDVAEQVTRSAPALIDVHNRPLNTSPPGLSGTAKVGQTLSASPGQWEGNPTSFAYRWLRCPAGVKAGEEASCTALNGAENEIYEAQAPDAGKSLVVRVTAINPAGSETVFSPASSVVGGTGGGGGPGGGRGGGTGAPQTKIVKHPRAKTALHTAKFVFSSDQSGSRFQCKLDRGAFKSCRTPFKREVKPGRHSFQVRAVSAAGVADPSPAKFRWKVTR